MGWLNPHPSPHPPDDSYARDGERTICQTFMALPQPEQQGQEREGKEPSNLSLLPPGQRGEYGMLHVLPAFRVGWTWVL